MKELSEIQQKLKAPFLIKDIDWRVQQAGFTKNGKPWAMVLAYVDARAVMDRLDEVFSVDGWEDAYEHKTNGVLCNLKCLFINRSQTEFVWITKQDGSPETAVEAFKGGISKALVRASVKFGIGRYLYNLESNFANCSLEKKDGWKKHYDKKAGEAFYWIPPSLPEWALPEVCDFPKIKAEYFSLLTKYYNGDVPKDEIELAKKMSKETMIKTMTDLKLDMR